MKPMTRAQWEEGDQVVIDEASPGQCPNLCEYIRSWLEAWGWTAEVETEW